MKQWLKWDVLLLALLIFAVPATSFSQYFQRLYDVDSSQEWGWSISQRPDNNYFIVGWTFNQVTDKFSLYNVTINSANNDIINYHNETPDSPSISIGPGLPGEVKQGGSEYTVPITVQWPNPVTSYLYSAGGLVKLNSSGATVFKRIYVDTSKYFDLINACARSTDGKFLIGGARSLNIMSSYRPFLLICTDNSGDTIWTKTLQKDSLQSSSINNIICLPDGRIVIGATTTYKEYISGLGIYHNLPWFLVLDSTGNVIKDTVYGSKYMVGRTGLCGQLYEDVSGGYTMIGNFDSLFTSDPSDPENYPAFIAHLDTNFRIIWLTEFPYTSDEGHRQGVVVRQLHDSSYVIVGDSWDVTGYDKGFAAKISSTGEIIWSHNYISEALQNAYLRDGVEKPDGSLILTGQSSNDTLALWHQHFDMWLIGVDSNGCEVTNCTVTGINHDPVKLGIGFTVYPNPSNGRLNINSSDAGEFTVFNMLGQQVSTYSLAFGKSSINLPDGLAAGFYTGRFKPENGGATKEIGLIFQP